MKHTSKAPWVRKIGNPSSLENVVMASYKCPSFLLLGRWKGISEDNPILCMLLKAVKTPIKYFVSNLPLPSPH